MKLIDSFMISTQPSNIRWKIFDKDTRKKLCDDYGALSGESDLDNRPVWSMQIKTDARGRKYIRVSVSQPNPFIVNCKS